MYILTTADGVAYRDTNNLPIIVYDREYLDRDIRNAALELDAEEALFLMKQAVQAVYGWRYLRLSCRREP